jgi:predicted tellurium resistance membrane protein TerC
MTEAIIALVALTLMEIVLGIDNIVFISVQTGKLPVEQRAYARWLGLAIAMGARILLLLCINWIMQLTSLAFDMTPLFKSSELLDKLLPADEHVRKSILEVSWKDLILFVGGLFLINSSVREIHHKLEGEYNDAHATTGTVTLNSVLLQIGLLDIIFSLDSVITAVGMVHEVKIMIFAIIVSVLVMMFFAGSISAFVEKHPTVKMLALSFLLLIGVMLVADAVGTHIEKGYIYFAMGFSLLVELLNLRAAKKYPPHGEKPQVNPL